MQQNENLSAYIDGEQVEGNLAEALCSSPELQQKWQSYHAVRSVMRGENVILGNDFSMKMEALLEKEEIKMQPKGIVLTLKRWSTPLIQVGVAASVCFAVVLGVNTMNLNNDDEFVQDQLILQTLPFTDSIQQVSLNLQEEIQKIEDEKKKQEELKKELDELDKVQQ
ncbi:Sigma-E factor negative regulatory protein [Phocoenobacter uteri]|uniref:Sigma-E factor negative regulatory protein n=1 Tax=Phocoenobacter uteri TaxID=146806 RepID=A0A379C935_9PAST|nr:RseA family anti-sigma factor [Phocoenobacter uteri]MDG6882588.1 hypothetical protein [Phocoenobacter uteri]SUB58751.1 Sigma-E factor negative regulatory protein [Phocoenobacter uteri]